MFLITIQSVYATNIAVHPGESIQRAVDIASNGDTIIVYDDNKNPYTYKESITINKEVHIIASGNVTIEAINNGTSVFTVSSEGSGTTIQNFRLTKTNYCIVISNADNCNITDNIITEASLVGIQFYGDIKNTLVMGNNITGLKSDYGNGISFEYGTCTFNVISGNKVDNFLNGILFNNKTEYTIAQNNTVRGYGLQGAGIYSTDNSDLNYIIDNTVIGYEDGIAIQKLGSNTANKYNIKNNTVIANKNGFWIQLSNSTISNNTATQNAVGGLDITGSYNIISHNNAYENNVCGIALGRYSTNDYNLVENNTLTNNPGGIYCLSNFTTISNNYLYNNPQTGIYAKADNVKIIGNTVVNSTTHIRVDRINGFVQE
jgi:parallel beta-helix repeat protein